MLQQLELASEIERHLRDTVDWGIKWFVDFNARKNHLVFFDWSNNSGAIDVKMMALLLKKNYILRCWDFFSVVN